MSLRQVRFNDVSDVDSSGYLKCFCVSRHVIPTAWNFSNLVFLQQ